MKTNIRNQFETPRSTIPLILIALLCLAPRQALGQDAVVKQDNLTITFLVNEGFLIHGNGKSVLIDAFVQQEYYGYGALPDSVFMQMLNADAPFDRVDLALTSHVHLDHFQTEMAVHFLQKHSNCILLSGEEVGLAVRNSPTKPGVGNQTVSVWPEPNEIKTLEQNGIRIDAFRLRHSGTRNYEVQNLGLIIHLGDLTVLHVGDAESRAANFEPFNLPEKKIDVAILPVWLFEDQTLVDEQIGAKNYIAAHIPVNAIERTKHDFAKSHPGVIVFEKPLEQWISNAD